MQTRGMILPVPIVVRTLVPVTLVPAVLTTVIVIDIHDSRRRMHGSVVAGVSVIAGRRWVIAVAATVVRRRRVVVEVGTGHAAGQRG
jgi:hypothetical protein